MEAKTYYSPSSALTISPPSMKGEFLNVDGETKRVGEVIIQFVPLGRWNFGSYTTDDPKQIAFLDERAAKVGDVFGPEEFNKRTTPAEVRAENASRLVEDQNRLIADLQKQLAAKGDPGKPVHPPTR